MSEDWAFGASFIVSARAVPLHSDVYDGGHSDRGAGDHLGREADGEGSLQVDLAGGAKRAVEDRGDVVVEELAEDVGWLGAGRGV